MKIRIHLKNRDKINALLADVNARANSHTYNYFSDVLTSVWRLDATLTEYGIAKDRWQGITAYVESGNRTTSAYKYSAITTRLSVYRGSGGWFLTDVRRSELWAGNEPGYQVNVSSDVLESVDKRRRKLAGIVATGKEPSCHP